MVDQGTIKIELVYIKPDSQFVMDLELPAASTIESAIHTSGILIKFPEIDLTLNKVGIFNKIKDLDHILTLGDRVEIYRPLVVDPKEARRQRANREK